MSVVIRRLLQITVILPLLSLLCFLLLHALPGDPEALIAASNPHLSPERAERLRELRGLDRPFLERYGCWLVGHGERTCSWWPGGQGILRGDLGWSRQHGRPVAELVTERLARTLGLMLPALVLAGLLALGLGTWAARRRGEWPDRVVSGLGFVGLATPLHWLAMMAVLVLALGLGWLPTSGIDDPRSPGWGSRLHHALLPIGVTAVFFAGRWLRYVRASVGDALGAPFVTALRARGAPEALIARRALRAAAVPVATVVGHSLPALFSGSVVIERVFVYPGMGALLLDAIYGDDYLVAMVGLLGYAAVTLVAALLTDLASLALDPRLRAAGRQGGLQ